MWRLLSAMWFGIILCTIQQSMETPPYITKQTTMLEAFLIMLFIIFIWYLGYSTHKELKNKTTNK